MSTLGKLSFGAAAFAMVAMGGVSVSPSNDVSFGTAANAQSSAGCRPGIYDSSHIVQPGDCYTWPEFNKAMKANGQQAIIVGNRIGAAGNYGEYFTGNAEGSLGFNAETDTPFGVTPHNVSIAAAYTDIKLNDVNASADTPSWASIPIDRNRAQAACSALREACTPNDIYLANAAKGGARIMMRAQTINSPTSQTDWKTGQIMFVFRDMNKGFGIVRSVNTNGANTALFAMEPANPTQYAMQMIRARSTVK